MQALFAALLEQPGARRYQSLRTRLLTSNSLGDFSLRLAELEQQLETNPEQAQSLLTQLLGPGLLSLRLHRLGGQAALVRGDHERAQLHRFTFDALTEALLATGNGTRRKPLTPTYASDAREVLTARNLRVTSQSLVEEGARRFDVLLAENEQEFWFEVTDFWPQGMVASVVSPPAAAMQAEFATKRSKVKRGVVSRR